LVSGCSNLFGPSTKVKEMPPDVISIQNITVIPSGVIRTEDQFSVYFDVFNQEEVDQLPAGFSLYDMGLCKFIGGEPNSQNGLSNQQPGSSNYYAPFLPRENRMVEWTFAAPSSDEIANIKTTCPIRFKFYYFYQSKSQIDVLVIGKDHFMELQRSGEIPTFSPTLNVGRGPVKIYFDFGASLPVKDSSDLPVYLTVQDKGTGSLNMIPIHSFNISFPSEFVFSSDKICPYFSCDATTKVCTNNQEIPMVNRKSLEIRCSGIKTPAATAESVEKTYFISSTLEYPYYVDGQVDVEVTPRST
jgi:hypothetical protein